MTRFLDNDLGKNITMAVAEGTSSRGRMRMATNEYYQLRGDFHFKVSTIEFSLHSATHIDVHLDQNVLGKDYDNFMKSVGGDIVLINPVEREERLRHEIIRQYSNPVQVECLLFDFTSKKEIVKRELLSFQDESHNSRNLLSTEIDDSDYEKFFQKLPIRFSDIQKKLEKAHLSVSDLGNKFLIFRTGWNEFRPADSLNNPIFEGWHAFLTHPYLESSCIEKLIELDILGLGSETPSMENFMFYVDEPNALQFVRNLSVRLREEVQSNLFRPVHLYVLLSQRDDDDFKYRYLIENIGDLGIIPTTPDNPVLECDLSILPFPLCVSHLGRSDRGLGQIEILDGILCSLYCKFETEG